MSTLQPESECTRGRVLIVEAPSIYREMQCLLLRRAGYSVGSCDEPHIVLMEATREPYDVVVLNSDAPGLDSPEFLAHLRRLRSNAAIIYVAAALTVELTRELTRRGITAVLQRPVSPVVLIEKIDEITGMTMRPGTPHFHSETTVPTVPAAGSASPAPVPAATGRSRAAHAGDASGSAASFLTWGSNPPIRTSDPASPLGSTSPFRSSANSPFQAAPASSFITAITS